MPAANDQTLRAFEDRAFERIREALAGRDPLYLLGDRNEFETFFELVPTTDLSGGDAARMKDGSIYLNGLPEMVRMHAQRKTSHVLVAGMNENWGAFSTPVLNRTVDWGVWQNHLADAGCTPEMVRRYLDDPAVKAVVTPHHTIYWHPKILSLPVGICTTFMRTLLGKSLALHHQAHAETGKTQDLLVNNSGWGHRDAVNQRVITNFGGRIRNTFGIPNAEFYESVTRSRFVLCPSGLGWDTSRLWETLTLGAIPVVEYSEGWHTALDDLPVLFVTNFDEVTPALLDRAYPQILSRCERFNYAKLTRQWWLSWIAALVDAARRHE